MTDPIVSHVEVSYSDRPPTRAELYGGGVGEVAGKRRRRQRMQRRALRWHGTREARRLRMAELSRAILEDLRAIDAIRWPMPLPPDIYKTIAMVSGHGPSMSFVVDEEQVRAATETPVLLEIEVGGEAFRGFRGPRGVFEPFSEDEGRRLQEAWDRCPLLTDDDELPTPDGEA